MCSGVGNGQIIRDIKHCREYDTSVNENDENDSSGDIVNSLLNSQQYIAVNNFDCEGDEEK